MAEFQLYDFRRIDKPLSAEERKQVAYQATFRLVHGGQW